MVASAPMILNVLADALRWGGPALALLGLLGAVAASRAEILPRFPLDRRAQLGIAALAVAAAVVRLAVVPAWTRHGYDGHEAEYLRLFQGDRAPDAGSTALYPAMQAMWWGLGHLLPHSERIPVLIAVAVSLLSIALLAHAIATLATPTTGWIAAALLVLHPAHAAWSSSAYNVIFPFALGSLALWAAARRRGAADAAQLPLGLLAGAALALTVATRVEAILWAVPLLLDPRAARARGGLWPVFGGLALGIASALPLLLESDLPGAGEHTLAFQMNSLWFALYGPWPILVLLAAGAVIAWFRWPGVTAVAVVLAVSNHLLLSTFDDFGERHTLTALPAELWVLAAGGEALRRWGRAIPALAAVLFLVGLADLWGRYYGSDDAFEAALAHGAWARLPRVIALAGDHSPRGPLGDGCGWVGPDPRNPGDPQNSLFNLWNSDEADALREATGCLRWCADAEDWRWSSRGERDRALRLDHLYALHPYAVVEEPRSGYTCLAMEVGHRRCCGAGEPPLPTRIGEATERLP